MVTVLFSFYNSYSELALFNSATAPTVPQWIMRDFKHILTARAWRPPVFKGNYQTLVFVIVRFYILHAFYFKMPMDCVRWIILTLKIM